MFTLRIANRNNGIMTIQAASEDAAYFQIGRRFDMALIDGMVVLEQNDNGSTCCLAPTAYSNSGFDRQVCARIGEDLVAFKVDAAEFVLDGDLLLWKVPPAHELPWTQTTLRCAEAVRRNLALRVASAVKAGVDVCAVTKAVPKWARGILSPKEWLSVVTQTSD